MSVEPAGPILSLCKDTSDLSELSRDDGLYVKPIARLNICVQLPNLRETGKSVTNWEIIERLRLLIRPDNFQQIRVVRATIEFVRIQAELENRALIERVRVKLDGKSIKLSGFNESLRVRSAPSKSKYPTRNDWEAFFRDNDEFDERKPGERPDTIHVSGLPIKWFTSRFVPATQRTLAAESSSGINSSQTDASTSGVQANTVILKDTQAESKNGEALRPNELVVRRVFAQFGAIKHFEIPLLSVLNNVATKRRSALPAGYTSAVTFDVFVQYGEYVAFDRAMNAFRDQKLVYTSPDGNVYSAFIQVDFDRTKFMTEDAITRRRNSRLRIVPNTAPAGADRGFGKFGRPLALDRERDSNAKFNRLYHFNANNARPAPRRMSEIRRSVLMEARTIRTMIEKRLERRILDKIGKHQRQLRSRFERTLARRERKRKRLKEKAREAREKRRRTILKRRVQAVRLLQFAFARLVSKIRRGELNLGAIKKASKSKKKPHEKLETETGTDPCSPAFKVPITRSRPSRMEAKYERGETPRPAIRSRVEPVLPEPEDREPLRVSVPSAVRHLDSWDRRARAERMHELRMRYSAMNAAAAARRNTRSSAASFGRPVPGAAGYFNAYASCLRKYGLRYSQYAPTPLIRRPERERDSPGRFEVDGMKL